MWETKMILFDVKAKVIDKQNRSIPRRDGNGTFDFTEVTLECFDNQTTRISARLANQEMEVNTGTQAKFKIGLTSNVRMDGRIWNSFVIMAFQADGVAEKPKTEYQPLDIEDDIPF